MRLVASSRQASSREISEPSLLASWLAFWSLVKPMKGSQLSDRETYSITALSLRREDLLQACGLHRLRSRAWSIAGGRVAGLWLELTLDPHPPHTSLAADHERRLAIRMWTDCSDYQRLRLIC
jgi:hypothetical protein